MYIQLFLQVIYFGRSFYSRKQCVMSEWSAKCTKHILMMMIADNCQLRARWLRAAWIEVNALWNRNLYWNSAIEINAHQSTRCLNLRTLAAITPFKCVYLLYYRFRMGLSSSYAGCVLLCDNRQATITSQLRSIYIIQQYIMRNNMYVR